MSLKFPDLTKRDCRLFRACGRIDSLDEVVSKAISDFPRDKWLRTKTRVAGKPCIVMVGIGVNKDKNSSHFHIDLASPKIFEDDDLPGRQVSLQYVRNIVAGLHGVEAFFDFEAHFWMPAEQISGLISATMFKMQSGPLSVKTKAVSLAVEGAPFYGVSWALVGDHIVVEIESRTKLKVTDSFLQEHFDQLEFVFDTFVCERESDVGTVT